jgi:hypothetical protein
MPTFIFTHRNPAAAAAAAASAAPARSAARIVALTATDLTAPRGDELRHGEPGPAAGPVPQREVDRGQRVRQRPLGGAGRQQLGVR